MNEDDLKQVAKLLVASFIERRDVKAMQHANGSYSPVLDHVAGKHDDHAGCPRVPWGLSDVIDHLQGGRTYGHYVVSAENTCRMFCFDIDLLKVGSWLDFETEGWIECAPREVWTTAPEGDRVLGDLRSQLFCMAAGLASRIHTVLGLQSVVAYSGSKGLHVYGLLERGTPAADAREAAMTVLDSVGCFEASRGHNFFRHTDEYRAIELEVYPKQDTVREGDGLGNLLRLPLGVNRKTGQRGFFVKLQTPGPLTGPFQPDDPIEALTYGSRRVPGVGK